MEFQDGTSKAPLKVIGKSKETGTQITFLPSKKILKGIKIYLNKFEYYYIKRFSTSYLFEYKR